MSRAALETLLRARKLDLTLTSAMPLAHATAPVPAASGLARLDDRLGGGLARGQLSEVVGAASSGRSVVMMSAIAAATARGELAALIDAGDRFDPASAADLDIRWSHLLWVRGTSLDGLPVTTARDLPDPAARLVDRAIKAAGLVLSSGGFGLLVLDLADVPPRALARLPFTTWLRFERWLEGRDTVGLVVAPMPLARGAGGVSIRLTGGGRACWNGVSDASRRFAGLDVRARLVRARPGAGDDAMLPVA